MDRGGAHLDHSAQQSMEPFELTQQLDGPEDADQPECSEHARLRVLSRGHEDDLQDARDDNGAIQGIEAVPPVAVKAQCQVLDQHFGSEKG